MTKKEFARRVDAANKARETSPHLSPVDLMTIARIGWEEGRLTDDERGEVVTFAAEIVCGDCRRRAQVAANPRLTDLLRRGIGDGITVGSRRLTAANLETLS